MDDLLAFVGTYDTTTNAFIADWGSDKDIADLLTRIKAAGDVTSADLTQMIALTGKANVQSQFVTSVIQEYITLMKALLQKMS
jgi:hypothetical protein